MPNFDLEWFKTLSRLNFAYIHSKRRKLGKFIPYQKIMPIYLSKQSKFATYCFIFNFS